MAADKQTVEADPFIPIGYLRNNFWIEGGGGLASDVLFEVALAAKGHGTRTIDSFGTQEPLDAEEAQRGMRALTNDPRYKQAVLEAAKALQEAADKAPREATIDQPITKREYNGAKAALLDSFHRASPNYRPSDPIITEKMIQDEFPQAEFTTPIRASAAIIESATLNPDGTAHKIEPTYAVEDGKTYLVNQDTDVLKQLIRKRPTAVKVAIGKLEAAVKNQYDPLHTEAKEKLKMIHDKQKEIEKEIKEGVIAEQAATLAPHELDELQKQTVNLKKPQDPHPDQIANLVRQEGTVLQKDTATSSGVASKPDPSVRTI